MPLYGTLQWIWNLVCFLSIIWKNCSPLLLFDTVLDFLWSKKLDADSSAYYPDTLHDLCGNVIDFFLFIW